MKEKHVIARRLLVLPLSLVLILSACAPAIEQTPAQPSEGSPAAATDSPTSSPTGETPSEPQETEGPVSLRAGWLEAIDCWNPYSCSSPWTFGTYTYDGFIGKSYAPECDATPGTGLADSWELSEDGLTWTIHLAEGITYSDGTPYDAHSAEEYFTWFSSDPNLSLWFPEMIYMESAQALDDRTVQYTTEIPVPSFEDSEGKDMWAVPNETWENLSEDERLTYEAFPPIGTGPYTLAEWEPGSYVIFEARPDYFRGKPPIDRIIFSMFGNTEALVGAYLGDEIDIISFFPPDLYDVLDEAPNTTIVEQPGTSRYELHFNMAAEGTKHPAIEDLAVRQAVDYAINKQQILDVALLGHGTLCPTNWACPPNFEDQLNPEIEVTPFDLERANQILDDAGYLDTDGDGIRETTDGLPLEFRLFYELEAPPELSIANLTTDWLAEIGISIEVDAMESGSIIQGVLTERDYDMLIVSDSTDLGPAYSQDYRMSCWSAEAGGQGLNYSGYCNEEFDELYYESWLALDKQEREDALFESQAIIFRDRPKIVLAGMNALFAYRSDRFEFPSTFCVNEGSGLIAKAGVMNAMVK